MPLAPGLSLLHYRLVEKVGEGGMGEVWRAVDTTLDREVAVKVLPAAFAQDPERMARFEREAKALALLSQPNIAAGYGFPEAEPDPGTGERTRLLALEFVRGEDLARIIERGPLPAREAVEAARQIAAALEAAHDRGIIHRDLKPANVRRTPEGDLKVLDFGLAKALETGVEPRPAAQSLATVTSAGTRAGMILGTASYMSPEQARGQPVDRRTDLWAFGCVLFEMLTGTKAFDGATVTDVLAQIVAGEPDWDRLPPDTPTPVRRLLRRCLEKDPGDVSLRGYDGTNQFLIDRKLKCFQATAIKPQDMADTERDLFPIWDNNTGMVFTITEIKGWSDTDNTTLTVEVVTATNWSSPATVDALEIATDGTSVYTVTETTISDPTIAHDEIITLDFDDTDDPGVVKVSILRVVQCKH